MKRLRRLNKIWDSFNSSSRRREGIQLGKIMFEEITACPELFQDRFRSLMKPSNVNKKEHIVIYITGNFRTPKMVRRPKKQSEEKYNYPQKKKKEAVIMTSKLSKTLHFIIKPSCLEIAGRLCAPVLPSFSTSSSAALSPLSHLLPFSSLPSFHEHTITSCVLLIWLGFLSISFHLINPYIFSPA